MSNGKGCQCGEAHGGCNSEFQYAVKLLCGLVEFSVHTPMAIAPGRYWTGINIHNPDKCKDAHFRWKVALAGHGVQGPVPRYQEQLLVLGPDRVLELDCPLIMQTFPPPPPSTAGGYVVIESNIELDVVAVYTTAQAANGPINTFHTERVQARCVPVCEDLVLPLHTGLADWQTAYPTPLPHGPVVPVTPLSIWAHAPFGSKWVSQTATDGTSATLSNRYYELAFDLCFGFAIPAPFPIQVLADDSAKIYLNGPAPGNLIGQVGPTSGGGGFQTPTLLTVNPGLLQAGRNAFIVAVTNGPLPAGNGPTGFALAGILRVARGKCPCAPLPIIAPSANPKAANTLFEQMAAAT